MGNESEPTTGAIVAAVRAAQAGDAPEARELLARRACLLTLRTASVLTGNRQVADEASQDVAIIVLRSIGKLREAAAFDAWVHRIAARRLKRLARKAGQRRATELPLGLRSDDPEVEAGFGADDLLALRAALASALATLPTRQQIAVALRYVHDLSDDEIAAALGCRVGTVHALLSRARARLRESKELAEFAADEEVADVGGR